MTHTPLDLFTGTCSEHVYCMKLFLTRRGIADLPGRKFLFLCVLSILGSWRGWHARMGWACKSPQPFKDELYVAKEIRISHLQDLCSSALPTIRLSRCHAEHRLRCKFAICALPLAAIASKQLCAVEHESTHTGVGM